VLASHRSVLRRRRVPPLGDELSSGSPTSPACMPAVRADRAPQRGVDAGRHARHVTPPPASVLRDQSGRTSRWVASSRGIGLKVSRLRFQNVYRRAPVAAHPYTGILSIFPTAAQALPIQHLEECLGEPRTSDHVTTSCARSVSCSLADLPALHDPQLRRRIRPPCWRSRRRCATDSSSVSELNIMRDFRAGDIRLATPTWLSSRSVRLRTGGVARDGLSRFVRWVMTQPVAEAAVAEGLSSCAPGLGRAA